MYLTLKLGANNVSCIEYEKCTNLDQEIRDPQPGEKLILHANHRMRCKQIFFIRRGPTVEAQICKTKSRIAFKCTLCRH